MSNISTIIIGGTSYDVKDKQAQALASSLQNSLETEITRAKQAESSISEKIDNIQYNVASNEDIQKIIQ